MGIKNMLLGVLIIYFLQGGVFLLASEACCGCDPQEEWVWNQADLNNDGKDELIVLKNNKIYISTLPPAGSTQLSIQLDKSIGENITSVNLAISDFNNDKKLDLALGEKNGISIYFNNGRAEFTEKLDIVTESPVLVLQSGDIDGDGDSDLVFIAGGIFVVRNEYDRTGNIFVTQILEPSNYGNSLFLKDVNGDCAFDIISPNKCYLNDGTGFFSETPYGVHCANPVHCSETTVNKPD